MNKHSAEKTEADRKPVRADKAARADRERAAQLGMPEYVVRLAAWEQLKRLPDILQVRHRYD